MGIKWRDRILLVSIMSIILCLIINVDIYAKTYTYYQKDTDIVFVVDYSNSMNGNDREKMALQMMETVIDTVYEKKTRIGFVAYNDTILKSAAPVSIAKKSERDRLKKLFASIPRSGSTDIGLALKEAEKLLEMGQRQGRTARMILISDGEPDLTYSKTGRTLKDCYKDIEEVEQNCKDTGISIDTIAFGDFDGDEGTLKRISKETGGKAYKSKNPENLIEVFNDIIKRDTMSSIVPISTGFSSGRIQELEVPLKGSYCEEANVLVVSKDPILEADISYFGEEVSYYKSKNYFTCKIKNSKDRNVTVKVKGNTGQELKAYVLFYQDNEVRLTIPDKIEKNVPFTVKASLYGRDSKKIVKTKGFYQLFSPKIQITKTGEKKAASPKINLTETGFQSQANITEAGNYQLKYQMSGKTYSFKPKTVKVKVENTAPTGNLKETIKTTKISGEKEIDLNQYFEDKNKDSLTYEFVKTEGKNLNILINNNIFSVKTDKTGEETGYIKVTDTDGEVYQSAPVTIIVNPIWKEYFGLITGAIVVIIFGISYGLWVHHKKKFAVQREYEAEQEKIDVVEPNSMFTGKLNAYFTKLPEDIDIEPLVFPLYQMKDKIVCLGDLLAVIQVPLDSLDAGAIFFKASTERNLVLYHSSKSIVMIGTSIICKRLKYSVEYGNKIYITSPDGEYELELHYVSVRS